MRDVAIMVMAASLAGPHIQHMLGTDQILHKGRYRIINSFSQDETGGMYEAYDTVSNTNVVLRESVGSLGKVATSGQIEAINAAFAGEAQALTEIKHEALVSVQDYFSEIDRQYLVLESVTGFNLTKYFEPGETAPALAEVLSWADQLLGALHYLHTLVPPVFHRDIRPENIKLTAGLKVKLLTANIPMSQAADVITLIPGQTVADTAFNYKPLEQLWTGLDPASQRVLLNSYDERSAGVLLRPLDARSDVYSMGASLYHVLTGTLPCDALERSIAILEGKPDPLPKPADLDSNIPPEVSDAFMRAMSIRRENRFDSAVIMRQILRTAVVRADERKAGIADEVVELELKDAPAKDIESAEALLEMERNKTGERQREIEAEEAHLDEERKRIEQRRLELEAEKERQAAEQERLALDAEQERKRIEKEKLEQEAEHERQRIAQRLADLESERERARAEEERLEREAEAERQRAEERLHALQAEQEIHRSEQTRIESEAKKELELAEQRLMELSGRDLDISETDDDEVAAGEPYLFEKPIARDEVEVPDFAAQRGFGWRMPAIAGAVVLVLAGSVGVWKFISVQNPSPSAVTDQLAFPVEQNRAQPVIESSPVPSQDQPGGTEPSASTDPVSGEAVPADEKPRLNAGQDKQKKPVPAKTPPPKKKITVDDLINDN